MLGTVASAVDDRHGANHRTYSVGAWCDGRCPRSQRLDLQQRGRSGYELGGGSVAYPIIMVFAAIVVFVWRPATLANYCGRKRTKSHACHTDRALARLCARG